MAQEALVKGQIEADIVEMILAALKDVLDNQGKGLPDASPATTLYGQGSDVDSLGFVQLLIDIEERVNARYGIAVTPTDEKAMSQKHSPFRTVQTLATHLTELVLKAQSEAGTP